MKSNFAIKKTKNFTPYKSMIFTFTLNNTNAGEDGRRAYIAVLEHREVGRNARIGLGEFSLEAIHGSVGRKIITTVPLSGASNEQRGIYIEFRTSRGYNFNVSISKIEFTV